MTQKSNSKHVYDLEERTFQFDKNVKIVVKKLLHLGNTEKDLKKV